MSFSYESKEAEQHAPSTPDQPPNEIGWTIGGTLYSAASSMIGVFVNIETTGPYAKNLMNHIKQIVETNQAETISAAITVLRCIRQDDLTNVFDRKQAAAHVSECLAVLKAFITSESSSAFFIFFLETICILSEVVDRLWHNVDIKKLYLAYMNDVYKLLDNTFRGDVSRPDVIFQVGSECIEESSTRAVESSLVSQSIQPVKSYAGAVRSAAGGTTIGAGPFVSSVSVARDGISIDDPTVGLTIRIPCYSGSAEVYTVVGSAGAYVHLDDLYDDIRYFLQVRNKKVGQPESCCGVISSKYYRRSMWQMYLLMIMIDVHRHQHTTPSTTASAGSISRNMINFFSKRVEFVTSRVFSIIDNGATKKSITLTSSVQLGTVWLDCCQDILALKGLTLPINAVSSVCGYITSNACMVQADHTNSCVLAGVAAFGYGLTAGFHRHIQLEMGVDVEAVDGPMDVDRGTLEYLHDLDLCLAQWLAGAIVKSPSSISLKATVSVWRDTLRVWTEYMSLTGKCYASDYSDLSLPVRQVGRKPPLCLDRADRFWNFVLERFLALSRRLQPSTVLACVVCLAPPSETFKGQALEEVVDLISSSSIKLSFDMLVVCQITPRALPPKALHELVANRVHYLSSSSDGRDVLARHNSILRFLDSSAESILMESSGLRSEYEMRDCARHLLNVVSVFINAIASVLGHLNSKITYHSSAKSKGYLAACRQDYLLLFLCIPLRLFRLVDLINTLSETSEQTDWNEVVVGSLETNINRFVSVALGNLQLDESRIAQLRDEEMQWAAQAHRVPHGGREPRLNRLYCVMTNSLCTLSLDWAVNARHHSSRGYATRDAAEDVSYVIGKTSKYLPAIGSKNPQIVLLHVILSGLLLDRVREFLADNIFNWPSNVQKVFDICHHITSTGSDDHWNIGPEGESVVLSPSYKTYIPRNKQLDIMLVQIKTVTYDVIIGLNEPVECHGLSVSQLRNFKACADDTVVGWEYCRLDVAYDSSQANIDEKIKLLEKICGHLRQLSGVVRWLRSINVLSREVTVLVPVDLLDETACSAVVNELQRLVALLGFTVTGPNYDLHETLSSLCYFICSGSNLYSAHFRKFISQRDGVENCLMVFAGIGELISAAHDSSFGAMRHLLDSDDILLSDFAAGGMEGFMDGLCGRSKEDVLKELKIITDFVEPNAGSVVIIDDIQMKISRVKAAVRLLRIQNVLGDALDACLNPKIGLLRHIDLAGGGKSAVQTLVEIRKDLETQGKFTLSDVPRILQNVDEILQGLEPGHLELLAQLNNAHQLLVFLQAERDFEGQLVLHTQEMQGTEIGGKVLTDLAIAHRFLKSLNLTSGNGPNWSFAQMVGVLRSTVPTELDADEVLGAISSASEHMAEISLWFSGGSAILNLQKLLSMVKNYMTDGLFVTVFSDNVEKSLLQLRIIRADAKTEKNIKAEVLVELIRGIVLSRGEAASEEDRSTLDHFLFAYDQAQRTHDMVIQARRNCVPCFHGIQTYEHAAMSDTVSLHSIEAEISSWYVIYSQKLQMCPRLHYLTRKQLLKCLHTLKSNKHLVGLTGYVRLCFPDCAGQVPSIMYQLVALLQAEGSRDFVGTLTSVYEECLSVFCDVLTRCNRTLIAYGLVEDTADNDPFSAKVNTSPSHVVTQAKPIVIKAESSKSHALYGELNSRNEGAPLPSQLLWCTYETTLNEMKDFILRASVWTTVLFAFMNVNLLRAAVRDVLLEACLDATASGLALHEHIYLFFCGERGLDAFTVLEYEVADLEGVGTAGYLRGMDTASGMSSLFPVINIVTGEACVGKSSYIADALAALQVGDGSAACTTLSIHEDMHVGPLVEWYRTNGSTAARIGLHVSICAHSLYRSRDSIDMEEETEALNDHLLCVAQFLHSLVHCGVLVDERTGDIATLNTSIPHYLHVELPSVLMYSSDMQLTTGSNTCDKHVYASLLAPVVQARTADIEVSSAKYPLKISAETRLVAVYVDHLQKNTLGGITELPTLETINASTLSDADALGILEGLWGQEDISVFPSNRTKMNFVRLMVERLKFLAEYIPFYKMESQHSGQEDAISASKTLVEDCLTIFLREVTAICGELSGDWSKANCAYTVRYTTSVGTAAARVGLTCLCGDRYINSFPPNLLDTVLRIDNACDNPRLWGALRSEVALAYGMDDTNRVLTLLQSQNYILTPDFAVKLLVLRDLHSCGIPAILQGSTGTGKTEQIQILSLLLNNRSDIMPNMVEKTHELLTRLVGDGILTPAKESHRIFFDDFGNIIASRKNSFDAFFTFLEDADDEFIEAAGCVVAAHFRDIFRQYGLLRQSDVVQGVLNALNMLENGALNGHAGNATYPPAVDSGSWGSGLKTSDVGDLADIFTGMKRTSSRPQSSGELGDVTTDGRIFRSSAEMRAFLREATSCKLESIFFVIRMHEGIGPEHWREKVLQIEHAAISKRDINIVAFVDELNTSMIMGMIKEVMMDGMLDGRPLPKNIFWIGATNPVTTSDATSASAQPALDITRSNVGIVDKEEDTNEYIVRSLLPSLGITVLDVGSLAIEQEKNFLAAYLFDSNLGFSASVGQGMNLMPPSWFTAMRDIILVSQEFVRNCGMMRTKVSIRDLMRTLQLYKFFLDSQTMDFFIPPATQQRGREVHMSDFTQTPLAQCWRALCLAISTVYHMRLSSGHIGYSDDGGSASGSDLRSSFLANLMSVIYEYDDMTMLSDAMPFLTVVEESLQHVYKSTSVPLGIASTRALQENIFACVTCFTACLPVIITGPPGCGKTLSMQIVLDNMKGASSPNTVYQNLKNANRFTYQCSEGSDAGEIKSVYENALQRHRRFMRARIYSERCVVCLDEASLPKKRRAALKVTHYYLDRARDSDRPAVSTIMLTNRTLDAAKTNRAVQLLQSAPSSDDLFALVKGCLMPDGGVVPDYQYNIMRGLCDAFQTLPPLYDMDGRKDVFQLRDFILFLRYLRRMVNSTAKLSGGAAADGASRIALSTNNFNLTAEDLVASLRRNFNGVSAEQFSRIVNHFLIHTRLKKSANSGVSDAELHEPKVLETLREAIADGTAEDEDPNHSAFRHIMIIDKTDTECSISLLFEMKLLNPDTTDICHMADFDDDSHDRQKIELAARIKHAVEQGRTIILSNAQSVYSAFYDLFNKHYSSVRINSSSNKSGDDSATVAGATTESPASRRYYANIGIGSLSRPCIVHPKARVIVHVTRSEFAKIQLPFLNRFEKYSISLKDVVNEKLATISRRNTLAHLNKVKLKAELFSYVMAGVRHFVDYLGELSFYGVLADETISALILRSLTDTLAVGSNVPIFQLPRHISCGTTASSWSTVKSYENDATITYGNPIELVHMDPPSLVSTTSIEEHVRDIGEDFGTGVSQEGGGSAYSSDPFCNIDKYIRAVNFQLLQLIRPEVLFMCRNDLPRAYLEEALERQEHFSTVNLVRGLCTSHWKHFSDIPRTNAPNVCTRWNVFTHTSSELLQLPSSETYQRLLLPASVTKEIDSVPGPGVCNVLRVVSISHFHRSMQIENTLKESIAHDPSNLGHRRILVIVADRTVVTSAQVSFVMRVVSQASDRIDYAIRPLIVLIQHFSAEMTQLRAVYDALPFAGWDMYYVDSFGYSEDIFQYEGGSDTCGSSAASEETKTDALSNNSSSSGSGSVIARIQSTMPYGMSDVRSWMLVAYGLNDSPSRADAINEFSHNAILEVKLLGSILTSGRRKLDPQLKRLGILKSLPLYRLTRFGGGEWLQAFFSSHTYILNELLAHVTAAWGQVLHTAVDYAVTSLHEGRTSLGMMDHTRAALSGFLKGFVRYAVVQLANEYGFESLAVLPTDSLLTDKSCADRDAVQFVTHILRGMQPPSNETLERYANSSTIFVSLDCAFVCRLPLFHFFSQSISTLRNDIILRAPVAAEADGSSDSLLKKMESEVQLNPHLLSAIEIVCNSPRLFTAFVQDYIQVTLPQYKLTVEEMQVMEKILQLQGFSSPLTFYAEPKEDHFLVEILSIISPLKPLADLPDSQWSIGALTNHLDSIVTDDVSGYRSESGHSGLEAIKKFTIQQIWDALISISTISSNSEGTEAFRTWLLAARDILVLQKTDLSGFPLKQFVTIGFIHSIAVHHPRVSTILTALRSALKAQLQRYTRDVDSFSVLVVCMAILGDTLGGVRMTDSDRADVYRAVSSPAFDSIFHVHSAYTDEDLRAFLCSLMGDLSTPTKKAIRTSIMHNHSATIANMLRSLITVDLTRFTRVATEVMLNNADLTVYDGLVLTSALRAGIEALPTAFPRCLIPSFTVLPAKARIVAESQHFVNMLHAALSTTILTAVHDLSFADRISALFARLTAVKASSIRTGGFNLIYITALATSLVTEIASSLAQDRELSGVVAVHRQCLESLFADHPLLIPLFVSSFDSDAAVLGFLSEQESVDAVGLPSAWFTPQQVSAELMFRCPPCMILRNATLYPHYNDLKEVLVRSDVSVQSLVTWTNHKCSSPLETLRCRQVLVLAAYHEVFLPLCTDERSRHAASQALMSVLDNDGFTAKLNLTEDETNCVKCVARGPHNDICNPDDGLMFYFSKANCVDPVNAMFRAAAVNSLSLFLGSRKNACFYYQCCFATERMDASMGLGSGYGRISKDCGYQTIFRNGVLTFDDHADNPAGPKFGEVAHLRAMNNYLIWIAYAWGAWVRMDKSRAMFDAYSWTTTYPEDYAAGRRGAAAPTLKQQIVATIIARANSFISMLTTDRRLAQAGIGVELFITLCTYDTTLQLSECTDEYSYFDKSNHEDALARQRDCMKYLSRIWKESKDNAGYVRDAYLHSSKEKLDSITQFRSAYTATAASISNIPDRAAVDPVIKVPITGDPPTERYRKIVCHILDELDRLNINLHLPLIVHFYKWMNRHLAYRVCESERDMTIRDAIDRIDDPELRAYGKALLQRFLRAWNTVVEDIGELSQICATAQGAGEGQLPHFDEDVSLSRVLTTGVVDDEDSIMRLLKNQIIVQNKLIHQEDIVAVLDPNCRETLNSDTILATAIANEFHVLSLPPTLRLEGSTALIGVESTVDVYFRMVCAASRPCAEIDVLSFDMRAAAVYLIRLLVSGKPLLTLDPRPSPFNFIRDAPPVLHDSTVAAESPSLSLASSSPFAGRLTGTFDPVSRVAQLTKELRKILFFPKDTKSVSVEVATLARQIRDESTAFRCLAVISSLAEEVLACCIELRGDSPHDLNQVSHFLRSMLGNTVQTVLGRFHYNAGGAVRGIISLSVASFIIYAEIVCRIQTKREYLFSSLQAKQTMLPLSAELDRALSQSLDDLLSACNHSFLNSVLKVLREVMQAITSPSVRPVILETSQSTVLCDLPALHDAFFALESPAAVILEQDSHGLDLQAVHLHHSWMVFSNVLRTIPISGTIHLLRSLASFCSLAAAKLTTIPLRTTLREMYSEMVPDDMKLFQSLREEDSLLNSLSASPSSKGGGTKKSADTTSAARRSGHFNWEKAAANTGDFVVTTTSLEINETQSVHVRDSHCSPSGWSIAHGGAPPIPPVFLDDSLRQNQRLHQQGMPQSEDTIGGVLDQQPYDPSNPVLFPPRSASSSRHLHSSTTTALSLSDMWGTSLSDVSYLASCGALQMDKVPGTGYVMPSEMIPTQLELLRSAIISVIDIADMLSSPVHPDMLEEVIQAHNIHAFQFFGILHILRRDLSNVLEIIGEQSDGSGVDDGGSSSNAFGADVVEYDIEDPPPNAPEFTYQTSDEMRDLILNGFSSFESPSVTMSLSDLSARWGVPLEDLSYLVDVNIVKATPPRHATDCWTVPTASVSDMQTAMENALIDVRRLSEMLGDTLDIRTIVTAAGMRVIRWGQGEFILSSDQNRAIDACLGHM